MSLKKVHCLLQLLHGTLPFHGHMGKQLQHFSPLCNRSLLPRFTDLCLFSSCFCLFFFSISLLDMQVSSTITRLQNEVPCTYILSNNYIPCKVYWDVAVNRSVQMINRKNSPLIKVINYSISSSAVLLPSRSWLFLCYHLQLIYILHLVCFFLQVIIFHMLQLHPENIRLSLHAVPGLLLPMILIL